METAAEQIRERLPIPEAAVETYESTESIHATVSMEAASETEHGCVIATTALAPSGWEVDEVSLHADTESMMVSYETEESR